MCTTYLCTSFYLQQIKLDGNTTQMGQHNFTLTCKYVREWGYIIIMGNEITNKCGETEDPQKTLFGLNSPGATEWHLQL